MYRNYRQSFQRIFQFSFFPNVGEIFTTSVPRGRRGVSLLCMCVVGRPEPCTSACLSCLQLHTMGLHCTTAELTPLCPRHTQPYSQLCRLFPICEEKTHYGQMNLFTSVWLDCWPFRCHFILCNVLLGSAEGALLSPLWRLMLSVGSLGQSRNLFSNRDDSSSTKNSHWKFKCIYKFRENFTHVYFLLLHKMISWKLAVWAWTLVLVEPT